MNTIELRIGNLLIDSLTTSLLKVTEISEAGFTTTVIDRSKFPLPDGWKANIIPLTEVWLLKFGFEIEDRITENHKWNDYTKDGITITMPYFEFDFNNGDSTIDIKSVHQLQNIYFALTGKELEVKNGL